MIKIVGIPKFLCKLLGHKWTAEPNSKVFVCERCGVIAYDIDGMLDDYSG